MTYLKGVPEQTRLFAFALGFGFMLGIVYDVFRTLRLIVSDGRGLVFAADVIYFFASAVLTFCFVLVFNDGEMRGYILAGEAIGWLVYYFSLGMLTVRAGNLIIRAVRCTVGVISGAIARPFKFVFRKLSKKIKKIGAFLSKTNRKSYKKTKIYLQKQHNMLYNFFSCMRR